MGKIFQKLKYLIKSAMNNHEPINRKKDQIALAQIQYEIECIWGLRIL